MRLLIGLLVFLLAGDLARGQNWSIWSMKLDGTDLQKHVADPDLSFGSVKVSPDGKQLAFDSWPAAGFSQAAQRIHICDLDGTNMRSLGLGAMPDWSSSGKLLTYHEYLKLKGSLIVGDDGKGLEVAAEKMGSPTWFPNGRVLAFLDWGRKNIQIQNVVTGKRRPLRDYLIGDINHGFSIAPDGKAICYAQGRFEFCKMSVMAVDEDTPARVIHRGPIVGGFSFHPDGKRVVFAEGKGNSGEPGNSPARLFIVNVEDSEVTEIPGAKAGEYYVNPTFSPDGERVFFSSTLK